MTSRKREGGCVLPRLDFISSRSDGSSEPGNHAKSSTAPAHLFLDTAVLKGGRAALNSFQKELSPASLLPMQILCLHLTPVPQPEVRVC